MSKVEEMIKPPKEKKKKKPNVKYTDRKTSSKPSTATVSSDEGSDVSEAETLSSGEEQFSTLTSYDGQKQYHHQIQPKQMQSSGRRREIC